MLNIVFLFLSRTRTHYLKIESKKFIQPLPGPMMVEDTLPMDEKINIDNMETFPILGAGGDEGRGNETDQVPIDDQYPIVEEHEEPEELGIKDTSPTPPKLPQLPPVPPSPPKVPVPKINFSFWILLYLFFFFIMLSQEVVTFGNIYFLTQLTSRWCYSSIIGPQIFWFQHELFDLPAQIPSGADTSWPVEDEGQGKRQGCGGRWTKRKEG